MTKEELLGLCDRVSNVAGCIPKNKHIWNAHGFCQWCHQSRLIVDAAEMASALRTALADVERLTKERDLLKEELGICSKQIETLEAGHLVTINECNRLTAERDEARNHLVGKTKINDELKQKCHQQEAELAALRAQVPQECGVPTEPGWYWWKSSERSPWMPTRVIPNEVEQMKFDPCGGQWYTCPPPNRKGE